jgi:hypothetical protein
LISLRSGRAGEAQALRRLAGDLGRPQVEREDGKARRLNF